MKKLEILKYDNRAFNYPTEYKFVYRITNVMRDNDDLIAYDFNMRTREYQEVLMNNFKAFNSYNGCFFENRKDAIAALEYLESLLIVEQLTRYV